MVRREENGEERGDYVKGGEWRGEREMMGREVNGKERGE